MCGSVTGPGAGSEGSLGAVGQMGFNFLGRGSGGTLGQVEFNLFAAADPPAETLLLHLNKQ